MLRPPALSPPAPLPPAVNLLLRCLLCLILVANATGSAWAATAMAGSLLTAPASSETGDHAGGHQRSSLPTAAGCHSEPPPVSEPSMPCAGDSHHCDCLQACSALPAPAALTVQVLPALPPRLLPTGGRQAPPLPQPVRPPIGLQA